MREKFIIVNELEPDLISSLKRKFNYVLYEDYQVVTIKPGMIDNAFCYLFIHEGKINLSDEPNIYQI